MYYSVNVLWLNKKWGYYTWHPDLVIIICSVSALHHSSKPKDFTALIQLCVKLNVSQLHKVYIFKFDELSPCRFGVLEVSLKLNWDSYFHSNSYREWHIQRFRSFPKTWLRFTLILIRIDSDIFRGLEVSLKLDWDLYSHSNLYRQWHIQRFFRHTLTWKASGLREAVTHLVAPY